VDILVFTDHPKLASAFRAGAPYQVRVLSWAEFRKSVDAHLTPALCYLDLATLKDGRLAACLRLLRGRPHLAYALVDRRGQVGDVARAFHEGAADYVDRQALREGLGARRLLRTLAFLRTRRTETPPGLPASGAARVRPSGTDWCQVVPGREYTFVLLFIELDGKEEMEQKYGGRNLNLALSSFKGFVEKSVSACQGKVWIWSGFGGIVLFPFSGADCPSLGCLFRMVLCKHIYDVEGSRFPNLLSFRLALTIGNLTYTQQNVGSVVSDSLNFVFHLGQDFAQRGHFYVTEEVLRFGHPALKDYFLEAGQFEGRRILRMRMPLHRKD
jgi:hypothetical protein